MTSKNCDATGTGDTPGKTDSSVMSVRERRSLFETKAIKARSDRNMNRFSSRSNMHEIGLSVNTESGPYPTYQLTPRARETLNQNSDDDTSTSSVHLSISSRSTGSNFTSLYREKNADMIDPPRIPAVARIKDHNNNDKENVRAPLGYLNPNFKPRRLCSKNFDKCQQRYQQQRTDMGDESARSNDPDARDDDAHNVDSEEVVPYKKFFKDQEEKILLLRDRYQRLEVSISHIENARRSLAKEAESLRYEKQSLTSQLDFFESKCKSLQSELEISQQCQCDSELELTALASQLLDCEKTRNDLRESLAHLQDEYVNIREELSKAELTIEQLMHEKEELRAENLRLQMKSDTQLEQQRIEHIQVTATFREELKLRGEKVQDLDCLLKEKEEAIQDLRRQLSEKEAYHDKAIISLSSDYQSKYENLRETVSTEVKQSMQNEIIELHAKLTEKSSEIVALRNDVSSHMHDLMVANTELQKLEEDSATLDGLFRDVEVLQQERMELSEILHERDTEIAELSAEILKLEIEKELCAQDTIKVEELKHALITAKSDCEKSEARLSQVVEASQYLEAEILRINEENEHTIVRIRSEYDSNIATIQSKLQHTEELLQQGIVDREITIASKDKTIADLSHQQHRIIESFQEELSRMRGEMKQAETAFRAEKEVHESDLTGTEEIINSLHASISTISESAKAKESDMANEIKNLRTIVQELTNKCADFEDRSRKDVSSLIRNKEYLLKENEDLKCTIHEQNRRLEAIKVADQKSVIRNETKISQLEEQIRQLKASALDMENCALTASKEFASELETTNRTILQLESQNEVLNISIQQHLKSLQGSRAQLSELKTLHHQEVDRLTVDLQNRTKEITILKTDLKSICDNSSKVKNAFEMKISCLQNESDTLRQINKELRDSLETKEQSMSSIEHLNETINNLRRERDFANMSLLNLESKLIDKEEQMAKLEAVLQERIDTLAISEENLNKLQAKVTSINHDFKVMEEQSSMLQVRLLDKEDEFKVSVAEWKKKEDEYLADIHIEQLERERLESELKGVISKLESTRQEIKDTAEIEKENEALKDKVRRQDAYLRRKLEKEKIIQNQDRKLGCAKKGQVDCKSPSTLSISTKSTFLLHETSDIDVDLDSLLAD